MLRSFRPASFALCLLLIPFASAADGEALSLKDLEKKARPPSWAKSRAIKYPKDKPYAVVGQSRRGEKEMKRSVDYLLYVVEKDADTENGPFFMLQLARHWLDLGEDAFAYRAAREVIDLPGNAKHNGKIYMLPNLNAVKREARFYAERVLARNGLRDETLAVMKEIPPQSGYEHARHAECLALLGGFDAAQALLPKANGGGNPERGFSDVFVRLRAAVIARAIGEDDLALQILEPVHKQGQKAQKWPQWQSSWAILDTLKKNIESGSAGPDTEYKDGSYKGECRGFVDMVQVQVKVKGGKIDSAKVTRTRDDRPWSAMETVPDRIGKRKSLNVDIVTGATVSSSAVITAADDALRDARK